MYCLGSLVGIDTTAARVAEPDTKDPIHWRLWEQRDTERERERERKRERERESCFRVVEPKTVAHVVAGPVNIV